MKASDLFVRCLEKEGITHIFGVPGEENADFMMSLQDSKIQFVLTRHEQGAAFMAEVYGRLTGNPAGALGTLGPGATNLITGVADANMDRAPMLVITGQGETTRQHKESHQVMNVVAMYEPVTKWAHAIRHPDNIPEVIRKAVRLARSEKPGAVLIELAEDIAEAQTESTPMQVRRFHRPAPDEPVVAQAWEMIRSAKRPVILAGNGTIRKRASQQLRRFCELTGIGVVSTFMAKGCVDRDADHCLFTIGLQARDHVSCVIEQSDLVITLGYDMVEYPPRLWNPLSDKRIIHIDFQPAEIDRHYHPGLELVGDLAEALAMLCEKAVREGDFTFDLRSQIECRRIMMEDFAEYRDDDAVGVIKPQKAIWDVRAALGPDDILLSGVGAHKMWIARYYHCHQPNTCLIPNGFCSMGMPLPGAIAADIVIRNQLDGKGSNRHVFAIAGDGDFLMNVQEMETAARLKSNITVMVWADGGYGLISWKQDNQFGRHTDLAFTNPDWMQLADAFGWHGQYIDDSTKLRDAVNQAINHPGPSLIALPIDYRENPKLTKRLGNIACPI
jgi:acetolactate synthase-1/2/3 large subunit